MLRNYYTENLWLKWWVWIILLIGGIVFPLAMLVVQSFSVLPPWWNPAPTPALLIFIGVFALIIINFMKLSINVNSENIKVRYGIARKTIPWNEVMSCEATTANFRVYGGVGIRLGVDSSLAFTTSSGNAVRITKTNGRAFVFSTKNPRELSRIINELSESSSGTKRQELHMSIMDNGMKGIVAST
jgi:hypothetical protein